MVEGIVQTIMSTKMGLLPVIFHKPSRRNWGFDGMHRDPASGKLVVWETKAYTGKRNPTLRLLEEQLLPERIERIARRMQDPQNKDYYTRANAKLGAEIIEQGADNIIRLAAYTDTDADTRGHGGSMVQFTEIHEMRADNQLAHIATYDVTDSEQPYPEGW